MKGDVIYIFKTFQNTYFYHFCVRFYESAKQNLWWWEYLGEFLQVLFLETDDLLTPQTISMKISLGPGLWTWKFFLHEWWMRVVFLKRAWSGNFRVEKIRVTTNQVWEIPNLFFSTQITGKVNLCSFAPHNPGRKQKNTQQECRAYTVTMDESRDSCTVEIRRPNGSSFVAKGGVEPHFWFNLCGWR